MKIKVFNRPIKVSTILKYALFSAWRRSEHQREINNIDLVKEWWYSSLANVYIRYWSCCPDCSTNQRIVLNQFGGEDYRRALRKLLQERQIEDAADSYQIDFEALKKRKVKIKVVAI